MAATPSIDPWPLAARLRGILGASRNSWAVIIAPAGRELEATTELQDELDSLYEGPVRRVSVRTRKDWLHASSAEPKDVLMLSLAHPWTREEWRALDMQRSRLRREGLTLLVLNMGDTQKMVTEAPNLWSWIGGSVWTLRLEQDVGDEQEHAGD